MKKSLFFLVISMFVWSGCDKLDISDITKTCHSNTDPQTITHDGETREYILHIPNSYDETSPTPIVLNFHGFGGSASDYMREADMRSVAERDTFILIYPQGSCLDGATHWNPCPIGGDNKSDVDDFGFIEALINDISSEYTVDTERIYAVGYSNGSMMAYGLASFKSDLIAAVASVSGTMLDCINPSNHPMPILHLHGTSDSVIPYDGNGAYNSAQTTLDYWIAFNNTNTTPTVNMASNGGITIEHSSYEGGDNSVAVEHYKYIGGRHIWFNTTYQGQNTAELIWDFVSKYDINGLR